MSGLRETSSYNYFIPGFPGFILAFPIFPGRSSLCIERLPYTALISGLDCLEVIDDTPDRRCRRRTYLSGCDSRIGASPPWKIWRFIKPGHLIISGPATFSTGGPVSNTGLALHRLGISTSLIAKVGSDPYGSIVRQLVEGYDPRLTGGLVVDPAVPTSYSVILSAPGVDRIFLHCPGANDDFCAEDVNYDLVAQARLFHFGYPPAHAQDL